MKREKGILTLKQIINAEGALNVLSAYNLKHKFSWEIGKFLSKINKPVEDYNKERAKFYQANGEFDKEKGFQLTDGQKAIEFSEHSDEILAAEEEITYPRFTLDELHKNVIPEKDKEGNKMEVGFKPWMLSNIGFMIIEDEDDDG